MAFDATKKKNKIYQVTLSDIPSRTISFNCLKTYKKYKNIYFTNLL